MEVAFPDWLHGHEHGSLDDAIRQSRNTQWAELAVGFRDIDSLHRLGAITLVQQAFSQVFQMLIQSDLQSLLIYSVDARCADSCPSRPS
jgi:hypothetical protein